MKKNNKPSSLFFIALRALILTAIFQLTFVFKSCAQLYIDGTSLVVEKNAELYIQGKLETDKTGAVHPKVANWGIIEVKGEVDFDDDTNYKGQGSLCFTGTTKQILNTNVPLKKIDIQNNSNIELSGNFNLQSELKLTSGHLVCGNYNLTIDDSVTITGGSSSSYIRINGTGRVKTKVGSDPVTLPIGRNPYLPIIIDDGGDREYTVGISENVYANPVTQSTQQTTNVVGETWSIQSSAAQNNVSVTLQWNAAEEETGFNRSSSYLSFWVNGVSTSWDVGTSMSASGSGPYSLTRTVNFSTNLFYFGVGSAGSALPVEFTYFYAKWQTEGESVILDWQTAMEENNSHFEIERSIDGQTWEQIGTVAGQGSTFDISDYQFIDNGLPITNNSSLITIYYRLKQVDYDGEFDYSEIEVLRIHNMTNDFTAFPNPSLSNIIYLTQIDNYTLSNCNGVVLKSLENTNQIKVANLAKGSYIITNSKGKSVLYLRN
ncbi:MAG: hypothetical protein JXQ87_08190 [Bacteroidia bacterium]